jgi:hypothetical protein
MKTYKEFRENRRIKKEKAYYADGFGWAMSAHFLELVPINNLEALSYGESDAFNLGVSGAIFQLRRMKHTEVEITKFKRYLR